MNFINKWISSFDKNEEMAVVSIINGIGSMPRENGAQMLISNSGTIVDSIGGGKLESDIISRSIQVTLNKTTILYHFDMTGDDVAQSDLICGGKGDAVIYYSPEQDIFTLKYIVGLRNPMGWLIFPIDTKTGLSFFSANGEHIGNLPDMIFENIYNRKDIFIFTDSQNSRYMVQWIFPSGRLHIMGAGHISREIAKIADIIEMKCTVYDDRSDFVNKERFPHSDCLLLDDFSSLPYIEMGYKDMIVIVTRGHLYDRNVLEWALKTDAGYIGMIGSRRKVDMILNSLIKKGFSEKKVYRVHTPIGLDIGARTPSEIAVSIIAQLIQFKWEAR